MIGWSGYCILWFQMPQLRVAGCGLVRLILSSAHPDITSSLILIVCLFDKRAIESKQICQIYP